MASVAQEILVRINGDSTGINNASVKAKNAVRAVGEEADKSNSRGKGMGSGFKVGAAAIAAGAAVGVRALVNFTKSSVEAFNGVQANITKFQTVAQNAGWSQALQDESTKAFGVISGGAARTAATTAASMGVSGEAFNTLKGPMGDLAVKMGGVTGANEKMGDVSQQVSKAIATGSASRLARYGVVLDDATQKQFQNANQQQRAQILADALNHSVGGLNEKLAATPAGQMQQLSNSVAAVKTNFGGLMEGSVSPEKFLDSVNKMVDQGIKVFTTMAPKLAEGVGTMATAVAQAAPKLVTGLIQGVMPALPQLISSIATAIPQVVQAIASAIPQVIQAILSALPQLIQGFIQLVMALVTAMPQIIQALIAAIPQVIQLFIQAILSNLTQIIQGLIQLTIALVAAIPQIIMALIQAIPQIISAIVQAVVTQGPQLIQGFTQIFSAAVAGIKAVFGTIGAWFGSIWKSITNIFGQVGAWFSGRFTEAKNGITNAFGNIGAWFGGIWNRITGIFGQAGSWFGNIGRSIWNGITGAVGGLAGWFGGIWSGIGNGVWNAISGIIDSFRGMGQRIWEAIRGGLRNVLGSVPVVGSAIVNALHLAKGGIVTGIGSDTSDNQLAALSPGEYVVNARSARAIGYDNMNILNRTGSLPVMQSDDHRATINVQANGTDPLALAQQLGHMLNVR